MRIMFMLAFSVGLVICFVYLQEQEKNAQRQLQPQQVSEPQAVYQQTRDEMSNLGGNSSS